MLPTGYGGLLIVLHLIGLAMNVYMQNPFQEVALVEPVRDIDLNQEFLTGVDGI